MLVCDGRTEISRGVRTRELADLMRYAGADEALNLDGGGSSTLYTSMLGVRNYPSSKGVQRKVGDGVFVVSTAPASSFVGGIDLRHLRMSYPKERNIVRPFTGIMPMDC